MPGFKPGEPIERVVALAASGDERAWREIVDRYARRVFAMARSRLQNDDLAEDLTQGVFATLAEKLPGGAYTEGGAFESWLFRITMNRVRDQARRAKARPTMLDASETPLADPQGSGARRPDTDPDSLARLRAAMEGLGDADREVIELRHHGQMSFQQIAELTGEPVGTLLARHHRALRKIRDAMERAASLASPRPHLSGGQP